MKYITKTGSPPGYIAWLVGVMLLGLVSQSALAALAPNGKAASGSTVSNTATLTFTVSGVDPTGGTGITPAVPASFVVDNVVDVLVANAGNASVTPNTTNQAVQFTVTNNGNTNQRYALAATIGATTPLTTPLTNIRIYRDNGASAGIWDATDTLYVDASTFGDVVPGSSLNILIVADVPTPNTNGQTEDWDLAATTVNDSTIDLNTTLNTVGANTAGVDVVFADAQGSIDAATPDGIHSATATFTISSASLSVNKTATLLCDPINGNGGNQKYIPGAIVQYAVTITNAVGGATATLAQVTDTLVAELAFDPLLIEGVGAAGPGAATTCSAAGNSLSGTGFGAVRGAGTTVTTYAAPGAAGENVTAGVSAVGQIVTIDFTTLAGTAYGAVDATLPGNSYITVYFNAYVQP
jgi:hypothetical protein